jgi:hypothetical protein
MGVYLSYYSIPPKQLEQFLRDQNEEQIFTSLLQERRQFPYTLHHIDVYAYGAIHRLLAPSSMPTVMLQDVIEGAKPFRLGSDQNANVMYLQQPRYLDTPTVKRLSDAMLAIGFAELIERFAAMEELASTTDRSSLPNIPPIDRL